MISRLPSADSERIRKAIEQINREGAFPRPAAAAVIVDSLGRILQGIPSPWGRLGKLAPWKNGPWQFPKGGIDLGETSVIAAIREAHEEASVRCCEVPGSPTYLVRANRSFWDRLGFGSPRLESGTGAMSLAAAEILRAAGRRLEFTDEQIDERLYDWFDSLAAGLYVHWQSITEMHIVALVEELPFRPWEWCNRRWIERTILEAETANDPKSLAGRLFRNDVEPWLEKARLLAVASASS